ncbi:UNVERIFIED_CONTAM: aldehyde dehydrogenase (NAD(P)(+)) ald5 [Siphonaria sp. JEL0065]|nr:aldehyde dehydrogenase (NAD(P)(+)) ald5 [Siphonaria sp. JEL0065]
MIQSTPFAFRFATFRVPTIARSTNRFLATKADTITLKHSSGRVFENIPTSLFIGGQFVPSVSGKTFETVDPNTGRVIAAVAEAQAEDVDIAVKHASEAFKNTWSKTSPEQRGKLLSKLADLVNRDAELLAGIEAYDNGKPFKQALAADISLVEQHLRYFAGWADKIDGRVIDVNKSVHVYTRTEPFGVVGQIIPWNFPLLMLAWKIAPALAAGNTIVLKTSEKTPLSALKLAQLINEAGFPAGVVNILSGFGATAGDAIARHKDIRKVSFTGSTATGKKIMSASAESNLKKVSLELGGKSPNIVFNDAILEKAVDSCITGFVFNQGQVCCAGTRVFVQEGIYNAFIARLKEKVAAIKVGPSFDESTAMGPLVDKLQFDKVLGYLEDGKKAGAKVETGGKRIGTEGYFVEPTIFSGVDEGMKIVKEEIFGPVISVLKFKTDDEVIERANATEFGLAASVHTESYSTAVRVSHALESGTVWINGHNKLSASVPFGGHKQSGFGSDGGIEAIKEYTKTKAVFVTL